ncbi:MAG: GlsB/YeaQ/YmgE family stress response membrane protein [Candidatus Methylomirabilales bacterium]
MDVRLLVWALVGILAGCLARAAATRGSYGLLSDLLLGLLGSSVATVLFELFRLSSGPASLAAILVALAGAAVVIAAQRRLWPPAG